MPRGFTVDSYFADAFGIIVEPEVLKAERIRIKATDINHRRDYLRKLPIHWSQREVEKHSDYSVFEVTLMPTYDFIQHILTMSSEVEVISPEHVRKEVIRWIKEMTSVYNL
jgi:predicted DNA-binding transcriptional regulator YafY